MMKCNYIGIIIILFSLTNCSSQKTGSLNSVKIMSYKDSLICKENSVFRKKNKNHKPIAIIEYNLPLVMGSNKESIRLFNKILIDSILKQQFSETYDFGSVVLTDSIDVTNYVKQHKKLFEKDLCDFPYTKVSNSLKTDPCSEIGYVLNYNDHGILSVFLYYSCGIKRTWFSFELNYNFNNNGLFSTGDLIKEDKINDFVVKLDEKFQLFKTEYTEQNKEFFEDESYMRINNIFIIDKDEKFTMDTFEKSSFQFINRKGVSGIEFYHPVYINTFGRIPEFNFGENTAKFFFSLQELKPFLDKELAKQLKI